MTSGKSLSDRNSEDTQTFEDRDYFVLGSNVYTRGEYVCLLKLLGRTQEQIDKATQWPAKISPFWLDLLLNKNYKQYVVKLSRDGEVVETKEIPKLALFYNSSTPYSFHYYNKSIIVYTLAKDQDHAIKNAQKKRVEQFLSKSWINHIQEYEDSEIRKDNYSKSWPGAYSWYGSPLTP